MAYRIRYQASIDWVAPGMGLGQNNLSGPGEVGGNAQTLTFIGTGGATTPTSSTFLAADVTALLLGMSNDLSTQMNAALTRVQNFSTGTG